MASTAEKLDPELWEEAKADAREKFGGHSARAMQYAVKLYKQRGGRYKGPKKKDNRLKQWSDQDWTTKSGRPSRETGERYLPRAAIESLTSAEYGATTRAKRRGGGVGAVVAQPTSIREKTRKFRKVNPMKAKAATPAQIAARKKFAERARSGELAKMRKKNPVKTAQSGMRKKRVTKRDTQKADAAFEKKHGFSPKFIEQFGRLVQLYEKSGVSKEEAIKAAQNQVKAMTENLRKVKTNPTATRSPERKRTKLITNGERKKNPRVRYADIAGPSVAEFKTVYAVHLAGQPSMNAMAYFTTKKNAVDTAQFLADETGKQVKVTRIQIAFN